MHSPLVGVQDMFSWFDAGWDCALLVCAALVAVCIGSHWSHLTLTLRLCWQKGLDQSSILESTKSEWR